MRGLVNQSKGGLDVEFIPGTEERLYTIKDVSSFDGIFRHDLGDYSELASRVTTLKNATGIGGTKDQLFHVDRGGDYLYEVNPITLAEIQNLNVSDGDPYGVTGMYDRGFYGGNGANTICEFNLITLADINNWALGTSPGDVAGTRTRLFYSATANEEHRELNPTTLVVINNVISPTGTASVLGAMFSRLFAGDSWGAVIYEMNLDTLASIGTISALGGRDRVGGLKGSLPVLTINEEVAGVTQFEKIVYSSNNYFTT